MQEEYVFSEHTYDMLVSQSIDWRAVIYVLYETRPRVRRWANDSVLFIIGLDQQSRWLRIALLETADHIFEIAHAEYLDDEQSVQVGRLL